MSEKSIEEMLKELEQKKLQIEIEMLELKKHRSEKWPQKNDIYYCIDNGFDVFDTIYTCNPFDLNRLNKGNFFETADQARDAAIWVAASLRLWKAYCKFPYAPGVKDLWSFYKVHGLVTPTFMPRDTRSLFNFNDYDSANKFETKNSEDLKIFYGQ